MTQLTQRATTTLRNLGGRMTAQRRLILETLERLGGHPNAEQVYLAVRQQGTRIHPSTVYRTLAWLTDQGLVNVRHLDSGRGDRCEHYDQMTPAEHHHFVCTACEQVIEFDWPMEDVKRLVAERFGATVARASVTAYGLCATCQLQDGSSAES